MMWGNGYNMMGWGWLASIVVLVLVVAAVIAIIRMLPGRANSAAPPAPPAQPAAAGGAKTPRQILDERYAEGALTTEEYRERIQNLGSA